MPPVYVCPDCRRRFSLAEFLAAGGLCPDCRRRLAAAEAGGGNGQASGAVSAPAASVAAPTHPSPLEIIALQVTPVKGSPGAADAGRALRDMAAINQLVNALGQTGPVALEIAAHGRRRSLMVRCERRAESRVRAQLTGVYGSPEIRLLASEEDPANYMTAPGKACLTIRLGLAEPDGLPIRTYRELMENDPVLPVLGALYDTSNGETALAQVVIHGPAEKGWAAGYKQELLAVKRGGALPARELLKWICILIGGLALAGYVAAGEWLGLAWLGLLGFGLLAFAVRFLAGSGLRWARTLEELVEAKIRQTGYRTEVRLSAAAKSPERAAVLLESLANAYQVYGLEAGNRFRRLAGDLPFNPAALALYLPGIIILGDDELATLWHLPVGILPDRLEAVRVDDTLPDPERVAPSGENRWRLGWMGKSAGEELPVYLPRSAISRTHVLFMGKTRTGKTTGLENAIRELAAEPRRSIVAIDPHDDMVADLLGLIPPERVHDVIYINFADPEYVPTINLLDVNLFDGDPERTAEALGEVAKALFKKYWGPRMDVVFDRTILALTLANSIRAPLQQFTILDALALLTMNQMARTSFLESVLPAGHIQRDTLLNYFQGEFKDLTQSMREQVIMPVLSKLRPFESNTRLLACFGQPESTFNPVQAVREGKIFFIRTGATAFSKEYSNFAGSLMLNYVRRAVFSQADTAPENRPPVTVIVDESQSFTGVDYGEALAQLAKFGGNLILTTQGARFIGRSTASDEPDDPHAFAKVLSNVDTLVVYRVSGEDAVALAETEFVGERQPGDLINLPNYQAFVRFNQAGQVIGPFRVKMDPPPPKDAAVAAAVLAGRERYSLSLPDALDRARRAARRIVDFYGSGEAAGRAPFDGEIRLPSEGDVSHPAEYDTGPQGAPPDMNSLIDDGVGLDNPHDPGTLRGVLGALRRER